MGNFRNFFCTLQTFYHPVPYPMRKKKNYKKILQITIYEKSKNLTVIVSQMSVLGQKNYFLGLRPARSGLFTILINEKTWFCFKGPAKEKKSNLTPPPPFGFSFFIVKRTPSLF